jgi:hypothetical protein
MPHSHTRRCSALCVAHPSRVSYALCRCSSCNSFPHLRLVSQALHPSALSIRRSTQEPNDLSLFSLRHAHSCVRARGRGRVMGRTNVKVFVVDLNQVRPYRWIMRNDHPVMTNHRAHNHITKISEIRENFQEQLGVQMNACYFDLASNTNQIIVRRVCAQSAKQASVQTTREQRTR